jgi:hypothetical protein
LTRYHPKVLLFYSQNSRKLATSGAIAGLAGGLVFGIMMGMMDMLPMVGMLVRQENAVIGFIVHMVISAIIGAIYGLVAGRFAVNATTAFIGGILNRLAWWVLGALVLMPLMLGMSQMVFVIAQAQVSGFSAFIRSGRAPIPLPAATRTTAPPVPCQPAPG